MTNATTILKNVKRDKSTFIFSVLEHNNRFTGTNFTVYVKQTTDMSDLGEDDFTTTYKIVCPTSMTEHAAINFAGKKLLKSWTNIS